MDLYNFISLGLDKTLRCFVCKNYLSYFPISLCSNNQSLCGRCAVPEGFISFREEAFETICQFLKFPCRYQSDGCSEELAPKDVPEHEKNCSFQTVPCIISKPVQCNWKGSLPSLLTHCRTEHSDLILKNGEVHMDFSVFDEYDSLLEHNDDLFIFTRRFDSTTDILSCALYNHVYEVNSPSCSAQLSIKNGNKTVLLDLKATTFTEMMFTELPLHCVKDRDKKDSFLCHINIGNTWSEEHRLEHARTGSTILSVLKCSICSEFALPPIYRCMKDMNTICSNCRPRHRIFCNICSQNTISLKSDPALEEIANLVEYPCKYRKSGCTSILMYRQMEQHHNLCEYGKYRCFISNTKCEWEGFRRDLNDHLLNSHQELLMNSSDELELSENDKNPNFKLIQFSNHLFLLFYKAMDSKFAWHVMKIGSSTKKFWYEIDIFGESNNGRRKVTRKHCQELIGGRIVIDYSFFVKELSDYLILKDNVAHVKFRVKMFT